MTPDEFMTTWISTVVERKDKTEIACMGDDLWQFIEAHRPDIATKIAGTPADSRGSELFLPGPTVGALKDLW